MKLHAPLVSTDWLAQNIDNALLRIFDATVLLTPNDPDPGYTIVSGREAWAASHIPGSHNVYYNSLLDPSDGTYLPLEQLRERFDATGVMQKSRAIVYCGGGVSATMDTLALTMLGHPDISVYDGSMFEWAQDPSLPLISGDDP